MSPSSFKLGEYRIKEGIGGDLSWESHSGFGESSEGKCFIKGRLLFLGRAEGERIGFLKGEFLDSLRNLPLWTRTEYYCLIDNIVSCSTCRKATEADVRRWCELSIGAVGSLPGESTVSGYRLSEYQISIKKDSLIQYKTCGASDLLVTGEGFLMEGILFLNQTETTQAAGDRGKFLSNLEKLPMWDKTEFFSFASSLKKCAVADSIPRKIAKGKNYFIGTAFLKGARKNERGLGKQNGARSFGSNLDTAERFILTSVKISLSVIEKTVLLINYATKVLWPILVTTGRWVSEKIKNMLRKNRAFRK